MRTVRIGTKRKWLILSSRCTDVREIIMVSKRTVTNANGKFWDHNLWDHKPWNEKTFPQSSSEVSLLWCAPLGLCSETNFPFLPIGAPNNFYLASRYCEFPFAYILVHFVIFPPSSLISDFGKQNTHGNVSKISVSLACYWQIGSKFTNFTSPGSAPEIVFLLI